MLDKPAFVPDCPLPPGKLLARGVARHLRDHDFACLEEFVPDRGLRVDVMALGPKSEFWVIECKSNRADFTSDLKWRGYLPYGDRFFFAVDCDFPTEILPSETGLILADGFDAEVIRMPEANAVTTTKRRKLLHRFGRVAAQRLHWLRDPMQVQSAAGGL